jgi:molybdate-binding protein/DNA-binding XRE family transcriptional regulator
LVDVSGAEKNPGARVAAARAGRGLSQSELARAARISRQALFQIEAGGALPRVDTAVRIAQILGTDVESLFAKEVETDIPVSAEGLAAGTRVDLANIDERWVSHPSDNPDRMGAGFFPSDGIIAMVGGGITARTRTALHALSENVFVAGCDPALEMLAQAATRAVRQGRCIWIPCGNAAALQRLKHGEAQVAGIHFGGESDDANLAAIRKLGLQKSCTVLRFSSWEQGWMLGRAAKTKFRGVESLPGTRLRLVNREAGSGCRLELDEMVKKSGVSADRIKGYDSVARNHAGCARQIAMGFGDVGLGCASMAKTFGLDFFPTTQVAFDLVIRRDQLDKPVVRAMCEILQSGKFLRALSCLPGYETSGSGRILAP